MSPGASPRPPRALVVDDSPSVRQQLAGLLADMGFLVEQADNGAVALRLAQGQRFDVVFLDLQMPVLDGPSLFRLLRARGDRVPVVLITATSDMRQLTATVKLGAAGYLPKPFDAGAVRTALSQVPGLGSAARPPEAAPGSAGAAGPR
jgi:CheY-like chemotaxis protein